MQILTLTAGFAVVAVAARTIGKVFSRVNLPYITGYLLVGMLAGPFLLGLLPESASESLRYIDEISLAVIAFVAGSELYFKELQSRLRAILLSATGIVIVTLVFISTAFFLLTNVLAFTEGLSAPARIATGLLGGTVLLALSPASTIAVIKEVRARGPFTKTALSITVFMDVFGIVLFAVMVAVADVLLIGASFNVTFVGFLLVDLIAAVLGGVVVGYILNMVISTSVPKLLKLAVIIGIGYLIFVGAFELVEVTKASSLPFEIHIEPILMAMFAGFYITNFTDNRRHFEELLHDIGPIVYVAFFTLTGVALKLDILLATLPIAALLFITRVFGIGLGSFLGGTAAGEPGKYNRLMWLALITQAGIALGLAREVAIEFPTLGDSFATLVISVVVLNEIFGPMLCKIALKRVGETNLPDEVDRDEVRDVVIIGLEEQSVALARQLQANNWNVTVIDTDQSYVAHTKSEITGLDERYIEQVSPETLEGVITGQTDAVVAMAQNDDDNLMAVAYAAEKHGVPRLIVRPQNMTLSDVFADLGAKVVDPASAMVSLLDQQVRTPASAALLRHEDPENEIVQVTVTNPDIHGRQVRDIRLPADVLILGVSRKGSSVVPTGYTRLNLEDEVTLVGRPQSLEEVTLRLGY